MVEDKNDLVYGLINNICQACSYQDTSEYTTDVDDILNDLNNTKRCELLRIV